MNIWGVRNLRNQPQPQPTNRVASDPITEVVLFISKISIIEMPRSQSSGKSWKITQLPTKTSKKILRILKRMAGGLDVFDLKKVQKIGKKGSSQKKNKGNQPLAHCVASFSSIQHLPCSISSNFHQPCSASSV